MRYVLLAALVIASCSASAEEYSTQRALSADFILPACKESPSSSQMMQGMCIGEIETLYLLAFGNSLAPKAKFCPPNGATIGQSRAVVIKYLDDRPEELHTPFLLLAIDALQKAWPCPK